MKTILYVAAECQPFVKTGGLADVCAALPKEFSPEDWDVRVVIPNYSCISEKEKIRMKKISEFRMSVGPAIQDKYVGIMQTIVDGVTFYLIDNQEYFTCDLPYDTNFRKDIEKFIFFDKAVLSMLPLTGFQPQIIHCHDWPTAMIPVFLKKEFHDHPFFRNMKTVMTIHNLKYQGIWDIASFKSFTGFSDEMFTSKNLEYHKNANMLKGGLIYADYITTVSPTYCNEIQTSGFGEGLEGILAERHMDMLGILSGIDYHRYDPSTDPYLFYNYDAENIVEGKRKNKEALQEYLGLKKDGSMYMVAVISKLINQKGLDLIGSAMDAMVDSYTQIVILGTGNPNHERMARDYAWKYPDNVSANIYIDVELAHKIYAAADAVLIPSFYKPCGMSQMIAMRYGAVPIVHETGGLKDTITAFDEYKDRGSGFSFGKYKAEDMLHILNYSKQIYFDRRELWNRMALRDMDEDYSLTNAAKHYEDLYNQLINIQ